MDSGKFVRKVQRYKMRHGVYVAAQSLRRQGISVETALSILAGAWSDVAPGRSVPPTKH